MTKRNKIIYWIATAWLALGMFSTGLMQFKQQDEFTAGMGYPTYFLTILGVWKILGAVAVLIPKTPLIKEWAYAGFFFAMTGAAFSHIATGTANKMFPCLLLLALTIISWYFRSADRRLILANFNK